MGRLSLRTAEVKEIPAKQENRVERPIKRQSLRCKTNAIVAGIKEVHVLVETEALDDISASLRLDGREGRIAVHGIGLIVTSRDRAQQPLRCADNLRVRHGPGGVGCFHTMRV